MNWPFSSAPHEVAVTASEITSGARPVLLVSHYLGDEGWAFLPGEAFSMEQAQLVTLKSLVDADPSLKEISDLPEGWSAIRPHVGGSWRRYEDPDLKDDA